MCEFCDREVSFTTKHHLVPRSTHSKKKIKNQFSKDERRATIDVCCDCHKTFHRFFSEKELAVKFYTLQLLNQEPKLIKYKTWIQDQREGIV